MGLGGVISAQLGNLSFVVELKTASMVTLPQELFGLIGATQPVQVGRTLSLEQWTSPMIESDT
ncbi:mannose-P-dolichol utilization defect 1 protein-like isoform [Sesbania bispinosa]|nr:mannose-P-dolichol utilization defect 1 protein-like isoform [Sesbania bispinosa]